MNKLITILALCGIIGIALATSCRSSKELPTVEILVLIDRTDSLLLPPESQKILSLCNLDIHSQKQIETGVTIRIAELSSVDFNHVSDLNIPAVSYLNTNKLTRVKQIKIFYSQLEEALQTHTIKTSASHSSVYIPIVRELNKLAKSKAKRKVAVLYTDLIENSEVLAGYRDYTKDKATLINLLEKQEKFSDLTGVEVILRYLPKNESDNTRYRVFSKIYQDMLTSHGATVSFEY